MGSAAYRRVASLGAHVGPRSLGGLVVSVLFLASLGGPFRALQPKTSWAEGPIPNYVKPAHSTDEPVATDAVPAVDPAKLGSRP